jgi:hypothetical protein
MEVTREAFLAALTAIPNAEKVAYATALFRNPQLLYLESAVERFCACQEGSAEKTAGKFVAYWEKRRQYFPDRAYLPMKLANGAMPAGSMGFLSLGWISVLPADQSGRRVVFLNLAQQTVGTEEPLSEERRRKCMFYMLQIVSEDNAARAKGIVLVVSHGEFCYKPHEAVVDLDHLISVMPVRVTCLHVLSTGSQETVSFFKDVVPFALRTLAITKDADNGRENAPRIHVGKSPEQIFESLRADGLVREGLPAALGGDLTSDQVAAWIHVRLAEDQQPPLASTDRPYDFPPENEPNRDATAVSVQDRRIQKRKRDMQQCRSKARCLHIAHLNDRHNQLREEGIQLEGYLQQAKLLIKGADPGGSPLRPPPPPPQPPRTKQPARQESNKAKSTPKPHVSDPRNPGVQALPLVQPLVHPTRQFLPLPVQNPLYRMPTQSQGLPVQRPSVSVRPQMRLPPLARAQQQLPHGPQLPQGPPAPIHSMFPHQQDGAGRYPPTNPHAMPPPPPAFLQFGPAPTPPSDSSASLMTFLSPYVDHLIVFPGAESDAPRRTTTSWPAATYPAQHSSTVHNSSLAHGLSFLSQGLPLQPPPLQSPSLALHDHWWYMPPLGQHQRAPQASTSMASHDDERLHEASSRQSSLWHGTAMPLPPPPYSKDRFS